MRAEISAIGVLIVIPENSTEAFAAAEWQSRSRIEVNDLMRAETFHLSSRSVKVVYEPANESSYAYFAQKAAALEPYKGTIGTCGYYAAKADSLKPKDA